MSMNTNPEGIWEQRVLLPAAIGQNFSSLNNFRGRNHDLWAIEGTARHPTKHKKSTISRRGSKTLQPAKIHFSLQAAKQHHHQQQQQHQQLQHQPELISGMQRVFLQKKGKTMTLWRRITLRQDKKIKFVANLLFWVPLFFGGKVKLVEKVFIAALQFSFSLKSSFFIWARGSSD